MKSRKTVELNERLNKRWLGYAAAAGAAGVGILTTPLTGLADIIFTYANSTVPVNGSLTVEIDSQTALTFQNSARTSVGRWGGGLAFLGAAGMQVAPGRGGSVLDTFDCGVFGGCALRLQAGASIGGYLRGSGSYNLMGKVHLTLAKSYRTSGRIKPVSYLLSSKGEWAAGGGLGYLGFMFTASDGEHYGWALLDVERARSESDTWYNENLVGYAYNTVPGAPITAGAGVPEPGTLGLLALGSLGLGFWRRRKAEGGPQ